MKYFKKKFKQNIVRLRNSKYFKKYIRQLSYFQINLLVIKIKKKLCKMMKFHLSIKFTK